MDFRLNDYERGIVDGMAYTLAYKLTRSTCDSEAAYIIVAEDAIKRQPWDTAAALERFRKTWNEMMAEYALMEAERA